MDYEAARHNMIEQQIRTWEVLDRGVLELFQEVHREDFVPPEFRQLALADTNIPLAHGQVMMAPRVEARLLQSLAIEPDDRILEIGTGTGFLTALLAQLGGFVTSLDLFDDFTQAARQRLQKAGAANVRIETADGLEGWPADGPYDAIAVTGSVPVYLPVYQEQLAVDGRLFIITGTAPVMEAMLVTRVGEREWATENLFETQILPLIGAPAPEAFRF